jgi:MarR family transcriptional regulator, transcriptional regulator for hemolysin
MRSRMTAPVAHAGTDHLHRHFLPLLAQVHRQWRRLIDRRLQPLGLTEATWLPLLHLARAAEPMRQVDLASSLSLDGSSVVRLLDNLEANGLVERVGGADRRAKTIHLTPQGKATVKRIEKVVVQLRAGVLGDVPDRELAAASALLERIAQAIAAADSDKA